MATTLVAIHEFFSIKSAKADISVDCFTSNDSGILFKCNERNNDFCATTFITKDGNVTVAICTGDWTQYIEPVDGVLPPVPAI